MVKTGRKKPRKNAMSQVLELLENKYVFATPDDIEVLYLYQDGVYIPGETTVKAAVEEILGDNTDTSFCNEVINHFKRRSYTPRTNFNNFEGEIPVLNGLLNLETMQLGDFDPQKIFTFKVNTKFDSSKECPKFRDTLKQILSKEDERALLQEYAGYTLLPDFPHHKFMVFIGVGRNGKGVIIRTITDIIGPDNVSNIRLEHLDGSHRFMVANLFGKLVNVCSEPSTRRPFKTELLKQITGQDALDGEIKNKQNPLKFTPFAKFYVQANKLPVVDDTTLSFWDRINIIEFTETFTDEKGNKVSNIEDTWLNDEDERSGILNWMIEGLKRLKENGKFTQTKSMDQQILKFKQVSDPIGAFLTDPEECIYAPILWVTRNDLYNAYKEYSENIGTKIESIGILAERIKRLPGVGARKKRVQGTNERIWTGISIIKKDATLEDFEEDEATEDETPEHKNGAGGAGGAASTPEIGKNNNNIKGGDIPAPVAPSAPFYAQASPVPPEFEPVQPVQAQDPLHGDENSLAQGEGTELAAESIQRDEPQSSEALEGEQAKAENEISPRYESSHTANVQDLYEKAVKVFEGTKGWLWAGEFWDALERLGHPRKHAEYPLKDPRSPVEFVGFKVRLKEAKP